MFPNDQRRRSSSLFENSLDPYLDGSIPAAWQRAAAVPHDSSFPYIPCRL